MNGSTIALSILLIGAVFILSACGMGLGMLGGGMMGYRGTGQAERFQDNLSKGTYSNTDYEKRRALKALDQRYYENTLPLENRLKGKDIELQAVLNKPDPDINRARIINREINDLMRQIREENRRYELEARRIMSGY